MLYIHSTQQNAERRPKVPAHCRAEGLSGISSSLAVVAVAAAAEAVAVASAAAAAAAAQQQSQSLWQGRTGSSSRSSRRSRNGGRSRSRCSFANVVSKCPSSGELTEFQIPGQTKPEDPSRHPAVFQDSGCEL